MPQKYAVMPAQPGDRLTARNKPAKGVDNRVCTTGSIARGSISAPQMSLNSLTYSQNGRCPTRVVRPTRQLFEGAQASIFGVSRRVPPSGRGQDKEVACEQY